MYFPFPSENRSHFLFSLKSVRQSPGFVSQTSAEIKNRYPSTASDDVSTGKLSGDAAYRISQLDDEVKQRDVALQVKEQKLNRTETRELVQEAKANPQKSRAGRPVTTKTIKLESGASLTVKARKKRVTKADWIAFLEEAIEKVRAA